MRIHCLIYYFKWHHPFLLPHNQISLSISAMKNAWKSQRSLRHILSLSRSLMAQQMNQSCEPPTKSQTQTVKLTLSPFSPAPSHSSVLQGHWALHSFSSNSVVFILIIMYYIFFSGYTGKGKERFSFLFALLIYNQKTLYMGRLLPEASVCRLETLETWGHTDVFWGVCENFLSCSMDP